MCPWGSLIVPVEHLRKLLADSNDDALKDFSLEVVQPDVLVSATIGHGSLGRAADESRPSVDFIQSLLAAVRLLRDGRNADRFRTLRLQCLGCCLRSSVDGYVAIGDAAALDRLLAQVTSYRDEPSRARRLYDALLRAYLSADREAAWFDEPPARDGTERLRDFLARGFASIEGLEPTLDWVTALKRYPEVLQADAGQRFAKDWLTGGGAEFADMSGLMRLSASSWLAADTLRGALAIAVSFEYESFVAHIDTLLKAAAEPRFESVRDEIYAGLLDRYAEKASAPVHAGLRDALVAAWKNPWLARNATSWRLVRDQSRRLVAGWLKLDLIHQFFEVMSDEGGQDKRRFEFWRSYHETIDDMYFALGRSAFNSRNPDMLKLRRALEGRLLELGGVDRDNSAFIMCIGSHVVVEFSRHGNACYVYRRDWLERNVADTGGRVGTLKDPKAARTRMTHRQVDWESSFAVRLSELEPKAISADPSYRLSPLPSPDAPDRYVAPSASFADFRRFALARSIGIEDHRDKGGRFWLMTDDETGAVNEQLCRWGFAYRAGRGWWKAG